MRDGTEPDAGEHDVLLSGETLIDLIPDSTGPLATVESFTRRAGGAPANVAVGLARLDRIPWFCTALSTDPFGHHLQQTLNDECIPDRFVTRDDEHPTTLAFVEHPESRDRSFTFHRENTADVHLRTEHVPAGVLESVSVVGFGGVALTVEPSRSATLSLIERATDHDCTVVFDPNARPELWSETVEPNATIQRALAATDLCKASQQDLESPGFEGIEDSVSILNFGPDAVVTTRGSRGARIRGENASPWGAGEWHHPGYDVEVVDATGAGDAFTAGLIAALLDRKGPESTLAMANAAGAATTTGRGAMAALPERATVEEVIDTGRPP